MGISESMQSKNKLKYFIKNIISLNHFDLSIDDNKIYLEDKNNKDLFKFIIFLTEKIMIHQKKASNDLYYFTDYSFIFDFLLKTLNETKLSPKNNS